MSQLPQLEDLAGRHILTGYGYDYGPGDEDSWIDDDVYLFYFTLDGATYVAREDPQDGYCSSMDLMIADSLPAVYTNIPPVEVDCRMGTEGQEELLIMTDVISNLTVLMVGTDDYDDYYPCFTSYVAPDNFYYNRPGYTRRYEETEEFWNEIELFQ